MGRSLLIFLLPVLLSLSLLVDATWNNLLPLSKQENNEDFDSLILQDAFEQNVVLLLPSKKENEMKIKVPQLVRTPLDQVQLPTVTHDLFSLPAGLREEESDSVFHPREGEGDSILRPRKGESDSFFVGGGRKGLRFGNRGAGCHHHHGGEMKFGHFREDHLHFRPQFSRSNSFPSSGDHGEETISSSFRSFPGEFLPQAENEESGFQPRERAFERVGGKPVFPEREHTHGHGHHGHGHHGQWEGVFPNGEEHKHERHGDPAAPWTDWLRSLFPRH